MRWALHLVRRCRRVAEGVCLLLVMMVLGAGAHAQEYRGVIYGRVTDATGAVIPGATVTATGPQQTYHVTTNKSGEYTLPFVDLGVYSVKAEAKTFSVQERTDVHIDVSSKIAVDFKMAAGAGTETVTVSSNDVGLNTADASGGTVMDPEKVQNLPLNGRQVYTMLSLVPGVKNTTTTYGPSGDSGTRGWDENNGYSINGQSGNYNQFALNGAPVSQQGGGGAGTWNIAPNLDAVDEFKVMTNTYDAQVGREAGGTVNTVLKSGTDAFHGTVFDFWRNSVLDANYWQLDQSGTAKPFHNEHQFGGTVGGPIFRHKTYFFGSFEGYRQVLPVGIQTGTVTPDMLPGADGSVNLTNYLNAVSEPGIYDPLTTYCAVNTPQGCSTYSRQQFPNNTIPANRISPIGLAIMKLWPQPNVTGNVYSNNFISVDPGSYRYNQPIARIDHDFSDATRFYGMFAWWSGYETRNGSGLPGPIAQGNINNYRSSLTQVLDLTHTFKPTLFADVRASFNRAYNVSPDGAVAAGQGNGLTATSLGLSMPRIPTTTHDYAPEINMYNCCTANIIGNTTSPTMFETYDLGPSMTQVLGRHTLHYGGEFMLFHDVPTGIGSPNGQFTFGTQFTQSDPFGTNSNGSGDGIAALLLGLPDSGSVDYFDSVYESYNYYAGYAQDDWKIRHNLTLNLGLRWETETSPKDRNDRLTAGYCTTCVNPLTQQIAGTAAAASLPSTILGGLQFAGSNLSAYENYWGTLLPKFGFSYALTPQLVMRGGYGLNTALGIELGAQSTWQQSTDYTASLDGGLTPSGYFNSGTPYPGGAITPVGSADGLSSGAGGEITFDRRQRKIPRVQQYSFGFQGAAPFQTVWDLEYVGAHTTRLRSGIDINGLSYQQWLAGHNNPAVLNNLVANPWYGILPASSTLGSSSTVNARRLMVPFPEFTIVYDYADPQGYSNYGSMQAKLEKRLTNSNVLMKGLSVLASFTWSKTMSATGRLNDASANLVDANPYYSIDGTDRPWDFALSGLYTLPLGKGGMILPNAHGVLNEAISDWQLDWIFQNDGGQPIAYPNTLDYTANNNGVSYDCSTGYNIRPGHHAFSGWLNNGPEYAAYQAALQGNGQSVPCWAAMPQYTQVTQLPVTTQIRTPWAQQTAIGLEKKFAITERAKFQFKAEAFNLTNTPIFGGPNTGNIQQALQRNQSVANPNDPGAWSGYGTIGNTEQNFPRQIQLSGKIIF